MSAMLAPDYTRNAADVVTITDPLVGRPVVRNDNYAREQVYSAKTVGPKYPAHNMDAPIFSGLDGPALVAAAVITLGPLAAYAFGFGL